MISLGPTPGNSDCLSFLLVGHLCSPWRCPAIGIGMAGRGCGRSCAALVGPSSIVGHEVLVQRQLYLLDGLELGASSSDPEVCVCWVRWNRSTIPFDRGWLTFVVRCWISLSWVYSHGKFVLIVGVESPGVKHAPSGFHCCPFARPATDFTVIGRSDGDGCGRAGGVLRPAGVSGGPSCAEGEWRGDGGSPQGRSGGRGPRAGVGGHLEEVEHTARISGQATHGLGDGEPARLDEADGEAA